MPRRYDFVEGDRPLRIFPLRTDDVLVPTDKEVTSRRKTLITGVACLRCSAAHLDGAGWGVMPISLLSANMHGNAHLAPLAH